MIKCPNCQHEEPSGALFCSNCGAQLIPNNFQTVQYDTDTAYTNNSESGDEPIPPAELLDYPALLYVVDYDDYIPLLEDKELTLGRASKDQPIVPDIDLKAYNAYDEGVSRLHATIKYSKEDFYIIDLGSVNGTKINGERIEPNKNYPLKEGDLISLGKLQLKIVINE